jgi:hypothetical protein
VLVSDQSNLRPESRPSSLESTTDDELISIETVETALQNVREGLPRGYRMRADRHYVDLLASPAAGQPVRMIAAADIDGGLSPVSPDLRPLIESVRSHGIVQPLIVRRRDARYVVVAGRKRLAAAQTLRLAAVPCFVHDVDDTRAAALEAADNLRLAETAPAPAASDLADAVQRLVADHLGTIANCADMTARGMPAMGGSMLDLVRAHAWRAARLIDALAVIAGQAFPVGRDRALASIADEVIDGFGPECRLNGVTLCAQIREEVSSSGLNDREILAGLCGAVIAVLPLVERAVRPTIVIKAANLPNGALGLELTQTDASVPERAARAFFDDGDSVRPGGPAAQAGAMAARALAGRHGGAAAFEAIANGSRLTLSLTRRS